MGSSSLFSVTSFCQVITLSQSLCQVLFIQKKVRSSSCLWNVTKRDRVQKTNHCPGAWSAVTLQWPDKTRGDLLRLGGHQGLGGGNTSYNRAEEGIVLQENVEGWDGQGEIPDTGKGKEASNHATQLGKCSCVLVLLQGDRKREEAAEEARASMNLMTRRNSQFGFIPKIGNPVSCCKQQNNMDGLVPKKGYFSINVEDACVF